MPLPRPPKHTPKRQAEIDRLGKQIDRDRKRLQIKEGKLFNLTYGK